MCFGKIKNTIIHAWSALNLRTEVDTFFYFYNNVGECSTRIVYNYVKLIETSKKVYISCAKIREFFPGGYETCADL